MSRLSCDRSSSSCPILLSLSVPPRLRISYFSTQSPCKSRRENFLSDFQRRFPLAVILHILQASSFGFFLVTITCKEPVAERILLTSLLHPSYEVVQKGDEIKRSLEQCDRQQIRLQRQSQQGRRYEHFIVTCAIVDTHV